MRKKMTQRLAPVALALGLFAACADDSEQALVASARNYLAKNEIKAAQIELKRALAKNASSGEARYLLGKALLADGDPVAAELELRKAGESGVPDDKVLPDRAHAMLLSGQPAKITAQFGSTQLVDAAPQAELKTWVAAAHAQLGQLDRANDAIGAALQANPHHAPALMVQARMKAGAGDIEGALRLLDGVLARDPGNEHAGVAKGYLLWLGKADAAGALQAYRKVLEAKPGHAPAQAEIVTLLFREGKSEQARQQFELLKAAAPHHPETLFFEAQFAYVDRQYRKSRELGDALLEAIPDHVRALELAAAAEYHLGNDTQVQAFLARALKVMPGLVLSRQILAQSYLRSGQPGKALESVAPLLEGGKADPESLALAGAALIQLGDAKKADAAFKKAAQLAPGNTKVRTEAAMAMLDGARPEVALRELEALAAGDQGPRADLALVSARISRNDMPGALQAIDALEAKLPGRPLPDQLRGQVLIAMRDEQGARASFDKALAKDAKYFPAVAALASVDVATAKPDQARKRLMEFIARVPDSSQAMVMLASVPSADGSAAPDVLKWLAEAVRANPSDAKAHLALISRHLQLGDPRSALAAAQAAAAALPNNLELMRVLGQTQLLAGEARQAASTFSRLTALLPTDAQIQMFLAEAQVAANDYGAAGRALAKAVEIDPQRAEARRGLAMLALRGGRVQDAIAIARTMQKHPPSAALGFATEGDVEAQRKNWAEAAHAYREALQRSGASEAAIKLHVALRASKQVGAADRVAADWEKKRPNDPAFRFYLGDLATQERDFAAAEAHYRVVLASQPGNALAMNNIAWLLLKQSKPGALEMAARADAALPNRAPVLDTLAAAQAAADRTGEAVETQKRAVASSPQDPALKLKLARYLIKADRRDEARLQLDALARMGDKFDDQAEVNKLLAAL